MVVKRERKRRGTQGGGERRATISCDSHREGRDSKMERKETIAGKRSKGREARGKGG